jgi:hypothetical protein
VTGEKGLAHYTSCTNRRTANGAKKKLVSEMDCAAAAKQADAGVVEHER